METQVGHHFHMQGGDAIDVLIPGSVHPYMRKEKSCCELGFSAVWILLQSAKQNRSKMFLFPSLTSSMTSEKEIKLLQTPGKTLF